MGNSVEIGRQPPGQGRTFRVGAVLQGTYRILRTIATGGMSEVYLAAHERLPSQFAIKALHQDLVRDDAAMSRFRREAEIMSSLRHPNIVQVFDFNVSPSGIPYLVMEYLEGCDLSETLRTRKKMEPKEVIGIVRPIAEALEAAHARGVVHRDLKPENVVLVPMSGDHYLVKVIDFGISKMRQAKRITANFTLLGTPLFMAPEQAQGRRDEVDHRTDQFALASMTYMLLAGEAPWRDDDPASLLYRIVHSAPEPLDAHVDWPTRGIEAVLHRALSKRREDRYPSVLAFVEALEEAVRALDEAPVRRRMRLLPGAAPRERKEMDTVVDLPVAVADPELRTRRTVRLRQTLTTAGNGRAVRVAAMAAAAAAVGVVTWSHFGLWARDAYDGVRMAVTHLLW